jgi:hypothetical protein
MAFSAAQSYGRSLPRVCNILAGSARVNAVSYATIRRAKAPAGKAKEEAPELDAIVRQFMKQVHPDRLIKHPNHRQHNERAVQVRY